MKNSKLLAIKRWFSKPFVMRRLPPISHYICKKENNELLAILELTYRKKYAPHNYPKENEIVIINGEKYKVVVVIHDYSERQVKYCVVAL